MAVTLDVVEKQADLCLDAFHKQNLSKEALGKLCDLIHAMNPQKQDLLYIQAHDTNPNSQAVGMSMVVNGQFEEPPLDPQDWPYQSVLEAIDDGWRVISFPDLSLLMYEDNPLGLGCEFILEKIT